MPQMFGSAYSIKEKLYACYYMLISLLTMYLTKPDFMLSGMYRAVYLIMVIFPLFFHRKYIPMIFTLFVGFSFASFYPLLPSVDYFYPLIVLVLYFCCLPKLNTLLIFFLLLISYFFFIEAFSINSDYDFVIWITTALFLSELINTPNGLKKIVLAYVILSMMLSMLFIINFDYFASQYMDSSLERSGWINPNVFGGIIGLGTVCSFYILLNRQFDNRILRGIVLFTSILSCFVLIINASRGAIISTSIAILFLFLTSTVKLSYKFLFLLMLAVFIFALYNFGYFELLETRFMSDNTESGGGRLDIWNAKFDAFWNLPIVNRIFGVGYSNCLSLGGIYMDTHNDFLTALFAYGYIGLVLFSCLLFAPLFIAPKHLRKQIVVFEIFLCFESMVLSPMMRGYFVFLMFLFVLYHLSYIERKASNYNT